MTTARRGTPPPCPRHPGSTVWFDGEYGTPARRRRRYRCLPPGGEPSHRFSEPLPHRPRHFSYTAGEVAAALVAVGQGFSYRAAAARVEERRRGPDGNSVADWVEVFAPVLDASFAVTSWPREVALDSLPLRTRSRDASGRLLPREIPAFQILGAAELGATGKRELVALQAFPGAFAGRTKLLWEEFLGSLDGVPDRVVCDPDEDIQAAVASVWTPAPVTVLCHSHLRRQLLDVLREEGIAPGEPLSNAGERAFEGPGAWRDLVEFYRPRRLRKLEQWLDRYGEPVAGQLERADGSETTTDALERKLGLIHDMLAARRGNLRNRERTNRMLMLVRLELNGLADEGRYAQIIEEYLLARCGRAGRRRAILDPDGSSLRP